MNVDLDAMLEKIAELALKIGLNLQPGQRVFIAGSSGTPLDAAPLVRAITKAAYQKGSPFVQVVWADEQMERLRFQYAPEESFVEFPDWMVQGKLEAIQRGDAQLSIHAADPDLMSEQDAERVSLAQHTLWQHIQPVMVHILRNAVPWTVITTATPAWANKVFPEVPPEKRMEKLWEALYKIYRLDRTDPEAAWREHLTELGKRSAYLTARKYDSLHYSGPGLDLRVGLPAGHLWMGGRATSEDGISFTPNIPTEELFTLPHRERVDGIVRFSKPLSYAGAIITGAELKFEAGRVVGFSAIEGEDVLRGLLETDEGAKRLGEVALTPFSSPISQTGLLFFNTLLDENAASHFALGSAYRFNFIGGSSLSDDEFRAAGGNQSLIHVDFMIGSDKTDIDGFTAEGGIEPVMRQGEWAFDV